MWFLEWARSPGFGGATAVVAAVIAFVGAWRQLVLQRQSQRKEHWWKRAEWALNLTIDPRPEVRDVGHTVLEALAASEWANEHEGVVIAAATARGAARLPAADQSTEEPPTSIEEFSTGGTHV